MGVIVHLDTNLLVELGKRGSSLGKLLVDWQQPGNLIATSTIAWSEFCNGPLSEEQKDITSLALTDRIINFDRSMAELASNLYSLTGRRRGSHSDCMIAASAIISEAPLSTLNTKDFAHFIPFGLNLHQF